MQATPPAALLRFAPGAPGVLEQVAGEPPPTGFRAGRPRRTAFRDVFHDTPYGDLERRGAWARVRHHPDGRRTLAVRAGGSLLRAELAEGAAPFDADSPPVRSLRGLADTAALVPVLESATDRRLRAVRGRAGTATVACDRRTVRAGELRAEVEEVLVRSRAPRAAKAVAAALRRAHGLVRRREAAVAAARAALTDAELGRLEEAVRSARRVAVLAMDGGRVALLERRGRLRVPAGPGAGEEACRQVLREHFGGGARVRLLGRAAGGPREAAVEVWLAEGSGADASDAGIARLPLEELLSSVGSPALRDRDTLAALHVAARTGLAAEGAAPAPRDVEARARAVLAALPDPDDDEGEPLPRGTLLNMELSMLAFNRRVLELAASDEVPLLDRVRFLGIFGGNVDEFFRVRVAGFKRQVAQGSAKRTLDGVTPQQQLDAIGARARRLLERAYGLLADELLPALAREGIEVVPLEEAGDEGRAALRARSEREIRPLLAPLTAGPGNPFPQVRNLRPALAALISAEDGGGRSLAIVELPDGTPRFLALPGGRRFVALEEVVRDAFPALYPGMRVERPWTFRVTRSAELHLDEKRVEDVLHAVEEEVRKRRFRPVVRLEVEAGMPEELSAALLDELRFEAPGRAAHLDAGDVYTVDGPVDLRGLRDLVAAVEDRAPALQYPPAPEPRQPLDPGRPLWEQLRGGDVLVSFPEDSFAGTVERLLVEAAADPSVLAIKLALYRTNPKSRIVEALTRAAAEGKQVFALVELTARFDEQRNIQWARYLRSYGIHVVYGLPGLKVHAKIALVVRREGDALRRYGYVGTGNLNASTAALYTDLGLLTADEALLAEVNGVFDLLTGAAPEHAFHQLMVAPHTMRTRFLELVAREGAKGEAGRITAKVNGLADREMIRALYDASRAGAKIDLLVRGICALRPGVPGLSATIRVYGVVGRWLEHARVFRFGEGEDAEYWIGSGDWRTRNLSRRVEVAVPIREPHHRARLDEILARDLARPDLWELGADGTYYRRPAIAPRGVEPSDGERRPILIEPAR